MGASCGQEFNFGDNEPRPVFLEDGVVECRLDC